MYVNRSDAAFIALTAALATPCFAQSTATAEMPPDSGVLNEVVVTGSRLTGGFATPTPVTMFEADALLKVAPTNIADALAQLPSLAGSVPNSASGSGSGNSGTNGQSLLNLRSLGVNRTLVLLDGQRLGTTNIQNSVDINIIPQNLVKRVDIVTGGASASYGSDAVAGAVNFVLDTRFEGLKTELSGGITDRGDAGNEHLSVVFGKSLSDRARVIGGVDVFRLDGLEYGLLDRDWFDHPYGAWPNPVDDATPTTVVLPNTRSAFGSPGGTITDVNGCATASCQSLVYQQFLPGGVVAPFNLGAATGTSFASGGDGVIVTNPFTPDMERESAFLHAEYDVNPDLTLWLQGGYNRSYTLLVAQPPRQAVQDQFTIFADNAYLPAEVADVFAANPSLTSFRMTRYDLDLDRVTVLGRVQVMRAATGAKGMINDRWSFDTTLSSQYTKQDLNIHNSITRNVYAAADAVVDPGSGEIVCRSTLQGLDPGCVPMNLFGSGSISQAANDYVMGDNTAAVTFRQTAFDANLRGDLGDGITLGAGPISVALGLAYRRETADRRVDALSNIYTQGTGIRGFPASLDGRYGGYQYYNPSPLSGNVSVTEGYVEFGVPLLKGLPMLQSLDTTVAGRLADYSQSGVEDMWKLGLDWAINDSLRIRGTVSQDTRAPSVLELFSTAQVTQGRNLFPYSDSPDQFRSGGLNVDQGNPDLTPEHARTYTAGIVLSPAWAPRFRASVDYYKIDIEDAITNIETQSVVDNCYFGDQEYCKFITVNGLPVTTTVGVTATDVVTVISPTLNIATESTSGIDIEAAFSHPLGAGDLSWRLLANYLLDVEADSGCTGDASLVGAIGNCGLYPEIRARLSANYDVGPFGIYVQERYIDGGKLNPNYVAGVDISFNDVPAVLYTDLTINYELGSWLGSDGRLFLNVTNVLDKDPPTTTSRSRSWVEPSELGLYDPLGRRYVLGVRFNW